MRTISTSLILLVLTLVSYNGALAQQPRDRTELIAELWVEHISPEGRFRVLFPEKPQLKSQDAKSPDGLSFVQYMTMASDNTSLYMVSYFDYAATGTFSLEKGRDGMVKAVSGTLLSDQPMTFFNVPGREFKVDAKLPNGTGTVTVVRMFDLNRRVYILQHMSLKEANPSIVSALTQKFFKSFSITANP